MNHFVEINPLPIEVLDHTDKFPAAAAKLAVKNSVFLIPPQVESNKGMLQGDDRLRAMISGLDAVAPSWDTLNNPARIVTPMQDLDMHGNPYDPEMLFKDYLHYHVTDSGSVRVTFAPALEPYLENRMAANKSLTEALRQGKTDIRYAHPDAFQVADITPGYAVIFRLAEAASRLPLLHDFTTTSGERVAAVTGMYRVE